MRDDQPVLSIQRPRRPRLEYLARAGHAARGVVYALIGVLALQLALGSGGTATGPKGALRSLAEQPFGRTLLAVLAGGLLCYALWRLIEGACDPLTRGHKPRALLVRAGCVGSGLLHAGWALLALGLAMGNGGGGGGEDAAAQGWTARLMAQPFGRWLVALVGLGVAGFGLNHLRKAWTASFMKHVAIEAMRQRTYVLLRALGRTGLGARGLIFCLIGGFLLVAALRFDPGRARGLGGTLGTLLEQPYGPLLLGAVAAGVLAFGCFNIYLARFFSLGREPAALGSQAGA